MDLKCSVCGTAIGVGAVEPTYRKMKEGRVPVAICPACQRRIEAQAKRQSG